MSELSLLQTRIGYAMLGIEVNSKRAALARHMQATANCDETRFGWQNVAITAERRKQYYEDIYNLAYADMERMFPHPPIQDVPTEAELAGYGTLIH